jgi:YggT family protein
MSIAVDVLRVALLLFTVFLFGRLAISFIAAYSRSWKPKGFSLVIVETVLTVTDPPVKTIRRVVPPLDLGGVKLDFSILILLILTSIVMTVLSAMR